MRPTITSSRTLFVSLALLSAAGCSSSPWQQRGDGPQLFAYNAIWAFAPDDVWIGGTPTPGQTDAEAAAHFDGSSWTMVDAKVRALLGLWAFGPKDIWAVGGDQVTHYDGSGWTATSLQAQGARDLRDIWGSAADDLWAVGEGFFHFDGTEWKRVTARISGVSAIWGASKSRVWAVGRFEMGRYDGSTWETFDLDLFGGDGDVWGFSENDVWLAADDESLAHWDGSEWKLFANDDIFGDLNAVWGATPSDVWAAGSFGQISHFDGSGWSSVDQQEIGAPYLRTFSAIHGSSANDIWAIGQVLGEGGVQPVLYHADGPP